MVACFSNRTCEGKMNYQTIFVVFSLLFLVSVLALEAWFFLEIRRKLTGISNASGSKTVPTEGQFVAVWEYDGLAWSGTYKWINGHLFIADDHGEEWNRVHWVECWQQKTPNKTVRFFQVGDLRTRGFDETPHEACDHLTEPDVCSFCVGISPDPSSCDCGYVERAANGNTSEIDEIPF